MAQAHASATLSTMERLTHVIVSAQTSTVSTADRSKTPSRALSAVKDTTSDTMATATNAQRVLRVMSATSSSSPSPSPAPAMLVSTGTAHVAVGTVAITALTALPLDPNIVVLVSSATSSLRSPTPVSTSARLASSRLEPAKSATAETP